LYERFLREMELMQVLRRAGDHGNWIDEPKRQAFKQELEELLYTKLLEAQALVNPKFARIKYYKRIPKGTDPERMVATTTTTTVMGCNACGKPQVSVKHKCAVSAEWQKVAMPIETTVYHDRSPLQDATTLEAVLEALKTSGFNPCSAHQLKAYMRAHKHPVGKNWKTDKDSADVKHIKKLMSKYHTTHPIYAHTVEIRQIQKTLSTYVNGLAPDANNLVHCTYVNSPSTWRLGCRNFNAQNLGKRNNNLYAKKARQIIVPRPGHVLVTADSSSIEAVMVGRLMQDTQYEQLARKGIHSYVTCQWLQLPFTPENIKRIKTEYAGLYDTFKTINHATNYGMGPYMMYMNEPEKFPTLHKAKEFQEYLFSQLPGLKEWHHQLRLTAKKNGYLDSPWGVRHYFYDVFTYQYDSDRNLVLDDDGQAKIKLGKDANKVIAFKPQNSAAMFMRDNLVQLAKTPLAPYMPAVVSIHDGYTVDVPEAMEQQAIEILVEILTRPIPEMDGLRVGCEVEVARENFGQPVSVLKVEV
jgi:DNA polymerase I-like protein with 3'-5' exonuclease and polymerase domains